VEAAALPTMPGINIVYTSVVMSGGGGEPSASLRTLQGNTPETCYLRDSSVCPGWILGLILALAALALHLRHSCYTIAIRGYRSPLRRVETRWPRSRPPLSDFYSYCLALWV